MKRVALMQTILRHARYCAGGIAASVAVLGGIASAHHPDKENWPVHQRIDVIGPVGNRLPPSHRRVYNRPTYVGGKIAYWIAPTSQEAMAWHRAEHSGAYKPPKKCMRLEQHYFYPKPWEVLQVGPRRSVLEPPQQDESDVEDLIEDIDLQVMPPSEPAVAPDLPEQLLNEPGELELPSLMSPETQSPQTELPEPEPPEAETPETESPSDRPEASATDALWKPVLDPPLAGSGVKVDPNAGAFLIRRGGVLRAMGMETSEANSQQRVSRAPVSQPEPDLETAEKPVFLRRWLRR